MLAMYDAEVVRYGPAFAALHELGPFPFLPVVQTLAEWVLENMPAIQATIEVVFDYLTTVTNTCVEYITMLKDAASAWVADHQETVNAILTAIQNLWQFVQTIFSALMTAAGALGDWLGAWADENLGDIVQTVTEAVNSIVSFVSAFASWAAAFWQAHGQTIMSIVRPLLEAVKTIISTALQAITQIFNIFAALFRGDWGELFRGIATLVLTILNGIVSTIGNIFQSIINLIFAKYNDMYNAGRSIFQGLFDGIEGVWNSIYNCKSLKIQGKTTEEIAAGKASEAETAAKKAAADELNAYKEAVTKDLADMQGQIDGQIETWFYDAEPSPTTPPASDWTTDELKENHAGDLYYSGKGYAYRWTYSGGAWTWLQIKDTDITAALQNAKRAQETANSKRRTFLVRPTPPYDIGDLWANGTDLLACVTARGEGASYSANDWETKTDYTTKKTAQLIVDASIEKIELGIAEDVSATDFFSTAAWKAERGSYTATSGSVTIAGDTATVVAPDSTETGKRRAVVIDVPTAMLAATQGKRVTLSMRYRVNAEISGNAVIVLWANYESGNESRRLVTLATTSQTTPAGDWTTATLNYTFKDEKPTRVYLFAYLYAGAGSLSAELPIMSEATGKKSTISLTKDGTTISSFALDLSKYATGTELKVGLDEISASVVKNGEIRSKFALDSSSCTISAGTIKFTGNTLVVESTNFNLNADGTVSITGAFYSNGSSGNATIRDGMINLSALNADGNRYNTISLSYTAKAYPSGSLTVYSRRADGTVGNGVVIQGGDADSRIWIYNAYGNADVLLTSGAGNNCEFAGGINVKGINGVNVSRAVSARDLKWWGDLLATGAQTRIKPRGGQNALYTDWQYWKSVNGVSYWVLTGKDTPW